jgi:trans-aconitate methyltransferase
MAPPSDADYWLKKTKVPPRLLEGCRAFLGGRTLDLGSAGGRLTAALAEHSRETIGLDLSAELCEQAALRVPQARFIVGDYQDEQIWAALGLYDLIASDCAIRRDYCRDLPRLADQCRSHLMPGGAVVLRVQGPDDLANVLTPAVRSSLYFTLDNWRGAFPGAVIEEERYRQRFSSPDYVRTYFARVHLPASAAKSAKFGERHYLLIRWPPERNSSVT